MLFYSDNFIFLHETNKYMGDLWLVTAVLFCLFFFFPLRISAINDLDNKHEKKDKYDLSYTLEGGIRQVWAEWKAKHMWSPGSSIPGGGDPRASSSSEETKSSLIRDGIETQSTNSNQLSAPSLHSRPRLPGAGITGLECKIDLRTTGSQSSVG